MQSIVNPFIFTLKCGFIMLFTNCSTYTKAQARSRCLFVPRFKTILPNASPCFVFCRNLNWGRHDVTAPKILRSMYEIQDIRWISAFFFITNSCFLCSSWWPGSECEISLRSEHSFWHQKVKLWIESEKWNDVGIFYRKTVLIKSNNFTTITAITTITTTHHSMLGIIIYMAFWYM